MDILCIYVRYWVYIR